MQTKQTSTEQKKQKTKKGSKTNIEIVQETNKGNLEQEDLDHAKKGEP